MAVQGIFFDLDASTLATLRTEYVACLSAIATAGQSYTISGRQFNRANLAEVKNLLAEVIAAQTHQSGTRVTQTYNRFT